MEESKRVEGSTFDTISKRKLIEDRDTILELTGKIRELKNEINCINEWLERVSGCWINSQWKFPRYQSTSVFPISSSSLWNAKPFSGNAEPQWWAAKHLGHTWYIGKRFCKFSSVFFSKLSAGVERTHSLIACEEEWKPNTSSGSEMPVRTVSQKFSHHQWRRTFQRIIGQTINDCRSQIFISTKFSTPATFACWKIRFKNEVCTCSQFPTEAMLWTKEVELVDSVVDQKSSRSIRGTQGPNFEVLDARIAPALNRMIHNSQFKRKGQSGGTKKAQKEYRFFRGRQIAYLIYDYFRVTGIHDSVENYADLFTVGLQNDDIQEFDSKWDWILLSMTKIPSDDILEGLYTLRIRESEKLKTVLELYNLEIHQKKAGSDYHRLKTLVNRSIEQNLRIRNFEARNGNYERNAVVKNPGTTHRGQRTLGDC